MAEDFPTKPLDQSVIFNKRTDKIDNTSDLTKSNPGNVIGDKIAAVQAFGPRITTAEGKIATLEAAAGLPGGVDLAADVAAVRLTRRYGRPGLAMRTWTSTVAATPAAATPLTVSGAYALADSANGPVVTITGNGGIGPIVPTYLEEDGAVKTFVFKAFKSKNDADSANNIFAPRFRALSSNFSDLGPISPANSTLNVASGLVSRTIKLSRDSAKSDIAIPAGTVWVREYISTLGTDGVTNILSIEQPQSSAADVSTYPDMTDEFVDEDRFIIYDASTLLPKKWSFAQLEAKLTPPVYWFKASKLVGTSVVTLVASPGTSAKIANVRVQNKSKTAFVAIGFFDVNASLSDPGSYLLGPGQGRDFDIIPQGRVSVCADTDGTVVTCEFTSTANVDPNSADRANTHLARYGGTMTDSNRTAVANYYNKMYQIGLIDLAAGSGGLFVGKAPNNFDGLIDWANSNKTFGRIAGPGGEVPDTSFAGTQFAGTNAIDTLITPPTANVVTSPNHSIFVITDSTSSPSGSKVAIGNTVLRVAPNRSSTTATVYTGAGSSLPTSGGLGGLQGYKRENKDNFRFYRNNTVKQDISKTVSEATGGSQTLTIGALNTATGLQFGWTGIIEAALVSMGRTPTDAQVDAWFLAHNDFKTALGV